MRLLRLIAICVLALPAAAAAQAPAGSPAAPADTAAAAERPAAAPDTTIVPQDRPAPTAPVILAAGRDRISPTLAVAMTPVLPGWGQLYADNGWRAVLAWGAQAFYIGNLVRHDRRAVRLRRWSQALPVDSERRLLYDAQVDEEWELMRDYAWWSMGAMLIIALDAYVGAHLHDFDRDPVPVPPLWDPAAEPLPIERSDPAEIPGVVLLQWRAEF